MTSLADLAAAGFVEEGVPLGPLTTYKSGGPARYLASCDGTADLERLAGADEIGEIPVLVLGRGSNLVVADAGFPGLVIRLGGGLSQVAVEETVVVAGGGAPLAHVARTAVDSGLGGLEFFVGIPGSVGGAIRQNAGCFGSETADRLLSASLYDLVEARIVESGPAELDLSYRHSNVGSRQVVVGARFAAFEAEVAAGREEMRRITRWRRDNQPGGTLNAGSVFKNPPGGTAGEIIDRLGLKGLRLGDVAVSSKHANFFVAGPRATSADIVGLVGMVKDRVFEASGTILEPEIQFVGFDL